MTVKYLFSLATRMQLLGLAAFGAACGASSATNPTPPGPPASSATVSADPSIAFNPGTVRITAGGTVVFNFGSVPHNVFFDNQPAGAPTNISGNNANTSKTLTFPVAGTFVFNCHIHPGMRGTVVVE